MDKKELKKEFQRKCKAEKAQCYILSVVGAVTSLVGLALVLTAVFIEQTTNLFIFPQQIICYAAAAVIAIIGLIITLAGETSFKKEFEKYINSKK